MGKGGYNGGGSKIFIGENGTAWETKWDSDQTIDEFLDRWDKRDDLKFDSAIQVRKRQRKQLAYFLLACARAYVADTLSQTFPPPPNFLSKQIRKAGGNAKWLASDRAILDHLVRLISTERTKSFSNLNRKIT
jgi:hypothetical protein